MSLLTDSVCENPQMGKGTLVFLANGLKLVPFPLNILLTEQQLDIPTSLWLPPPPPGLGPNPAASSGYEADHCDRVESLVDMMVDSSDIRQDIDEILRFPDRQPEVGHHQIDNRFQ